MGVSAGVLRRAVRGLPLSLAACAAAVLALELGLRLWAPQSNPLEGLFREDARVGMRHVPLFEGRMRVEGRGARIHINSLGLRGPEPSPSGGAYRVLGLGDSFAFGFGVAEEETYLARLQRLAGTGVEVVNAGHCGFGTDNEALLLEADGEKLRPDLVLLAFYVGNDLWNVLSGPDRALLRDGALVSRPGLLEQWDRPLQPGRILPVYLDTAPVSRAKPGPLRSLLRHSHAYRFLSRRWANLRARWRRSALRPDSTRPLTPLDDEAVLIREDPPEFVEGWARVKALLEGMAGWCKAHGCRLAVVVVPSAAQVDPARWQEAVRRHGLRADEFDLEKPQRVLRTIGDETGIAVLDLLPALRRAAAEGGPPLYFRRDPHWTGRGHEVAAHALLPELRARGLVP